MTVKLSTVQKETYNPYNIKTFKDLTNVPDDYHAVLAPSAMSRILACPASVQESLEAPIHSPSEAALRGTMLHEVTEKALSFLLNKKDFESVFENLDPKDVQQVLFCIDEVESLIKMLNDKGHRVSSIKLEERGTLERFGLPFIHGTADLKIKARDPNGVTTVYVRDWKFGFVEVYSEDEIGVINPQLHVYGLMQLDEDVDYLDLGIVQPAHYYNESVVVARETSVKWINSYFIPVITEAMGGNARFNPGEHQCRFCPVALTCRERHNKMQEIAKEVFFMSKQLPHVVIDELVEVYLKISEYKKYISAIEKHLLTKALNGDVPKLKAVHGRSNRSFKNIEEAENFLLGHGIADEQLYTSKLISPAAAEKLNRKLKSDENWKAIIETKQGKPQLVAETDTREAVTGVSQAERAFHDHIQ